MAFEYTEEQRSLQETLRRSFSDTITSEFIRGVVEGKHRGTDGWKLVSELGLFEFFAEDNGPSLVELMIVAFESGRVLMPIDVAGALCAGPFLLRKTDEYRNNCALSDTEYAAIQSGAAKIGIGVMNGTLDFVGAPEILRALVLDPAKQSLTTAKPKTLEGSSHAALDLSAPKFRYEVSDGVLLNDQRILSALRIIVAAELSGILDRVVEMTREYATTRKQFGVPIGSFQAVQQQLADVYLKSESLLSLVQFAAWSFDHSPDQLILAATSALGYAIDVVPTGVETAIQLHGGIGFTWEYDLHLYLRRARSLATLFALSDEDYERVLEHASQTV